MQYHTYIHTVTSSYHCPAEKPQHETSPTEMYLSAHASTRHAASKHSSRRTVQAIFHATPHKVLKEKQMLKLSHTNDGWLIDILHRYVLDTSIYSVDELCYRLLVCEYRCLKDVSMQYVVGTFIWYMLFVYKIQTHNLQLTRVELLLMEVVAFPKLSIKVEADIILPSSEEDSL